MNALLSRTDVLLNVVEEDLLRERAHVNVTVRQEIAILAQKTRVPVGPVHSNHVAHDAILDIQARILRPFKVSVPKTAYHSPTHWYPMTLDYAGNTLPLGTPEWWEYALGRLDRLEARWAYAATWARKNPSAKRALVMERAWDDYYTAYLTLSTLPRPK